MSTMQLNERDNQFFDDVYFLMKNKYPEMIEKFGLWRAHQHFELEENEVFHETSDLNKRESTLRIIKKTDLPEHAFASTWKLTDRGPIAATWCCDDRPMV
jgi:hypothetical protein